MMTTITVDTATTITVGTTMTITVDTTTITVDRLTNTSIDTEAPLGSFPRALFCALISLFDHPRGREFESDRGGHTRCAQRATEKTHQMA
jgi:hypothetical protein